YERAQEELSRFGAFATGVFTRHKTDGGRINQDAYEAVWEHVTGRRLIHPEQRYARPVFMQPEHFNWIPLQGHTGVSRKLLGVFSERGTKIALYRVEGGAALRMDGNAIYFVNAGAGTVDGIRYSAHATIFVEMGESATTIAESESELLQLGLPCLD
ncbi:MAG: hypothetical protein ACREUU_09810, partial [Gammaproteobacteria bacterium]